MKIILKFIISGGTAAFINFSSFLIFTKLFHFYYLTSSVLAFILSAVTSFCLQKIWTFKNVSIEKLHIQFGIYFSIILLNLTINTSLVYLFVEYLYLGHFVSQVIAGSILAIESFFIFKHIIFKNKVIDLPEKHI